ncbi:hypothetical protein LTR02_004421 [Friedmanniomyces endolithicus]|nr:hypothetical protein LTR94_021707 [Friedmanniomyces endolithicus]KAK0803505.1 hypothetical protein LTR59_004712 [Friedmanniomyces endolithicus]KAK0819198.1 hypothetical protein LTR38_000641 [Friedmanniomyces endolithicus]KAK0821727.1 hypothetical protein LTR75_000384 [Friedmanniomyces endolithicus]KAK0848093.1 hypothetical protein LTR03_005992 [Friedmanniomyces endolithicus]
MAERQTRTSPCPSHFGPGLLRTNVDIDQHPTLGCMKNIVGTFDFQPPGQPWRRVGNITAFIIDKRAPGVLDQNLRVRKQWIQELLKWKRTDPIVYPVEHAASQALSVFFNAAGARRPRYWLIDRELKSRRIVFVDSFVMAAHYRRGGTGSVAFDDFHRVLRMYRGGPNTNIGALKLLQADIIDLRHLAAGQRQGDYQRGLVRFYSRHRYTRKMAPGKNFQSAGIVHLFVEKTKRESPAFQMLTMPIIEPQEPKHSTRTTTSEMSVTNMQLPTRADFFSTSLVPTTVPADFECPISLDHPTDPVKLPCGHVFDRSQITTHLTQPHSNRCPLDRSILFSLPTSEVPLLPDRFRQAVVTRAIRAAGLAFDQPSHYDSFDFALTPAGMARAVPSAQQYLLGLTDAPNEVPSGPALLSAEFLGPRVVAMGNIIPALAAVNGRPYTVAQWRTWRSMISRLPRALARRDKQVMDAMVLLTILCGYLNPLGSSAEADEFFCDEQTPLTIDMDCLLLFIGWSSLGCWGERARRRRERRQGAARRLAGRHCEVM